MNSGLGVLTLLAALPLIGSVLVAALPRNNAALAKQIALGVSLLTLALAVVVALRFEVGVGGYQLVESVDWIPALGVSWTLGVDGLGLILILLSALLVPVVLIAGWHERADFTTAAEQARVPVVVGAATATGGGDAGTGAAARPAGGAEGAAAESGDIKGYLALILLAQAMMIGVFTALDVFLFYVFFEAILIPVYFMIGRYGTGQRAYAAVKFLIYSLAGGLVMLAALAGLWAVSRDAGGPTFDLRLLTELQISETTQAWLFLGFFIAFAIKAPLFPVHTWLPDAAGSARPTTAVLLIGVLDKIGTFGMMRLCLPLFPDAAQRFAPVIIALSVVSILYGALLAIGQTDMRRLFAYVSISHFGFITLGIFVFTTQGLSGATFYMLGHGLSTALLFCIAGYLMARRGSAQIADYGGVNQVAPVLAGTFLIAGLTAVALPGLSTFVSEFLVLVGTFVRYPWVGVIATLGIILAAVYVLWLYQRTMTGPAGDEVRGMPDLNARELLAIGPVIALVILLGFYPKPALDVINPTTDVLMEQVGATDPEPAVPAAEGGNR
jgi:NADH-quinone oxidoreductase subunit M